MPTGQFDKPQPSKLIKAMQALQQKAPVTAVNRLYVTGVQTYYGTWQAAEVADANLSIVKLQGGTICRFVAKGSHVTGLSAGDTVKLEKSPGFPLHITAKLVGNYLLALSVPTNVTPPSKPGSFAAPSATSSSVTLTWTASTDNFGSGITYNVYVNGKFRQSTSLNALTSTVTGLTAGTTYSFYITATDGAGNVSAPTSTISKKTSGTAPVPPGTTVTKTYKATKLFGYNYNGHNERDTWHDGLAYQGNPQDGKSYNQFGLIFFDWNTIAADLAGQTITGCSLSITYAHFYYNSGGKAIIGTHDYLSVPSTQSDSHADKDLFRVNAKAGTRFTVNMGVTQGNNFKSGHARGIQTGPQPSDIPGGTCYGYTYGLGSHVPVLTFTYVTS